MADNLSVLKQYYLMKVQEAKTEVESESYYNLYCQVQKQINELVDKPCDKKNCQKEC